MVSSWTKSALENWVIWFSIKLLVFSVAWIFFIGPNIIFLPAALQRAALVIYVLIFLAVVFAFEFVLEAAGYIIGIKKH